MNNRRTFPAAPTAYVNEDLWGEQPSLSDINQPMNFADADNNDTFGGFNDYSTKTPYSVNNQGFRNLPSSSSNRGRTNASRMTAGAFGSNTDSMGLDPNFLPMQPNLPTDAALSMDSNIDDNIPLMNSSQNSRSPLGERSSLGERSPTMGERSPTMGERSPTMGERSPTMGERSSVSPIREQSPSVSKSPLKLVDSLGSPYRSSPKASTSPQPDWLVSPQQKPSKASAVGSFSCLNTTTATEDFEILFVHEEWVANKQRIMTAGDIEMIVHDVSTSSEKDRICAALNNQIRVNAIDKTGLRLQTDACNSCDTVAPKMPITPVVYAVWLMNKTQLVVVSDKVRPLCLPLTRIVESQVQCLCERLQGLGIMHGRLAFPECFVYAANCNVLQIRYWEGAQFDDKVLVDYDYAYAVWSALLKYDTVLLPGALFSYLTPLDGSGYFFRYLLKYLIHEHHPDWVLMDSSRQLEHLTLREFMNCVTSKIRGEQDVEGYMTHVYPRLQSYLASLLKCTQEMPLSRWVQC